ncbi:MAG: LexA family protein [Patescibacteria group bacterium]
MLTPKQQKVFDIVKSYIENHGESPTLDEIQEVLGARSKHSVVQFLDYLERKGYISRGRGYRSIRLGDRIVASQIAIPIPILGVANAGRPLLYAEESDNGKLLISKSALSGDEKKYFCVKLQGTSMNAFSIRGKILEDGAYVLVDSSIKAVDNPFAAYLCIVNGAATVKKVKQEGESIYLLPDSKDPQHSPIILSESDSIEISGKVVDVFNFG